MSKRITSIALFDKDSLDRLNENIKGLNENFCKVPFREENRESLDTLPYHLLLQYGIVAKKILQWE